MAHGLCPPPCLLRHEEEAGKEDDIEKINKTRKDAIKSAVKQTVGWTFNEIEAQVMYDIGKYASLTEDYKMQVLVSNAQETINRVKSLSSSIIGSAMLGAKIGGGGGALVGATIGLFTSGTSQILNMARSYDQQNISLSTANKQSQYAQSRLGLIDNGRGTQN